MTIDSQPPAPLTIEQKIVRDARKFDLRPLVDLLHRIGYAPEEILFESSEDRATGGVVDAVRFLTKPNRTAVVTVNLGLLGDATLLPSYFLQMVEKSADPDRFYDFIRFFDHRLIEGFYRASYPESDESAFRSFSEVQRSFTRMLGMGSTSTLAWLVKLLFPELRVKVARRAIKNTTAAHAFRTGIARLDGTGILGKVYESDAAGFVVDLVAEEEMDGAGRAWPHEVRTRLDERLLPILAPHRLPLVVRLRVLFHASWAEVDAPFSAEKGYLGFERIRGDAEAGHTVVLYRGITGETRDETAA